MNRLTVKYLILIVFLKNQLIISSDLVNTTSKSRLSAAIEHADRMITQSALAKRRIEIAGCGISSLLALTSASFCLCGSSFWGCACGSAAVAAGLMTCENSILKKYEINAWGQISRIAADPDDKQRAERLNKLYTKWNIPYPSFDIERLNNLVDFVSKWEPRNSGNPPDGGHILDSLNGKVSVSEKVCMTTAIILGASSFAAEKGSELGKLLVPFFSAVFLTAHGKLETALGGLAAYKRLAGPEKKHDKVN